MCLDASPSSNCLVLHNCKLQKSPLSYQMISFPLMHCTTVSATWCRGPCFSKMMILWFFFFLIFFSFYAVEERETVGKSVVLSNLSCIFTEHLAELKQILAMVLYSQWDKLAQFAMPLHLDMRVLFDRAKTKGQDLWQYHQNEKSYSHSLSWDHRLQLLYLI